jgi:hypothetical protein
MGEEFPRRAKPRKQRPGRAAKSCALAGGPSQPVPGPPNLRALAAVADAMAGAPAVEVAAAHQA